ncbi:hypothetical protein Tco_0518963 [Tanacetum coccineum]
MSTTAEQITNNPTSAVRNTGGRNGPQGLEEPMSDECIQKIKRQIPYRSPAGKEGALCLIGWEKGKEPVTSARSDSRRRCPQAKKDMEEVIGIPGQEGRTKTPNEDDSLSDLDMWERTFTPGSGTLVLEDLGCPAHVSNIRTEGEDQEESLKVISTAQKTEVGPMQMVFMLFNSTLTGLTCQSLVDKLPKRVIE